jgi:ubiquinone biosynthesis protein COQ9
MPRPVQVIRLHAIPGIGFRRYHSYDHPTPPRPFSASETAILAASLVHVPKHGFTNTSLALGAKDAGYLDVSTNLFPKRAFSLVHYHLATQRVSLRKHSQALQSCEDGKALGIGAKVKALTWARLLSNEPIIHRWQEVRLTSISTRNDSAQ